MNCSKFSFLLPVWNLPISISHIEFQLNTKSSRVRCSINFFSFFHKTWIWTLRPARWGNRLSKRKGSDESQSPRVPPYTQPPPPHMVMSWLSASFSINKKLLFNINNSLNYYYITCIHMYYICWKSLNLRPLLERG